MARGPKRFEGIGPVAPWDLEASDADVLETDILDFDPAELSEFMAGDLMPNGASQEFRERLRADLWRLVDSRYGRSKKR